MNNTRFAPNDVMHISRTIAQFFLLIWVIDFFAIWFRYSYFLEVEVDWSRVVGDSFFSSIIFTLALQFRNIKRVVIGIREGEF